MGKRLLCVLTAAVLFLGALTGCGGGPKNDGPSSGSDPVKPGVGSTAPGNGGHTNDDPVAVMNERIKAVNDAVNYECVKIEEMVKDGLLFYGLTQPDPLLIAGMPRDYNPDKPLDYRARYYMYRGHAEGIVNEDTYVALLKNERYTGDVAASDVIETDGLYVYYSPADLSPSDAFRPWCYILVKGTNIVYLFTVTERWSKADYYENGYVMFNDISGGGAVSAFQQDSMNLAYTEDDAEYIFTAEFWTAFAQTVKFVGNPDEDFKKGECLSNTVSTLGRRGEGVKIPYIEEWYAGGKLSRDTIRRGFEKFFENREVEAYLYFDDGTVGIYPAKMSEGDTVTIDLGGGQVWVYELLADGRLELEKSPREVTGKPLPETGYCNYSHGFLVIDDFGRGEPTMFFNNALYRYAPGGEGVTLIHDFSDLDENWADLYTNADRTHLLFFNGSWYHNMGIKIDLRTFEVTDSVYIDYDIDEEGFRYVVGATVNGVDADEAAAWSKLDERTPACDVWLGSMETNYTINLNSAWNEYRSRPGYVPGPGEPASTY